MCREGADGGFGGKGGLPRSLISVPTLADATFVLEKRDSRASMGFIGEDEAEAMRLLGQGVREAAGHVDRLAEMVGQGGYFLLAVGGRRCREYEGSLPPDLHTRWLSLTERLRTIVQHKQSVQLRDLAHGPGALSTPEQEAAINTYASLLIDAPSRGSPRESQLREAETATGKMLGTDSVSPFPSLVPPLVFALIFTLANTLDTAASCRFRRALPLLTRSLAPTTPMPPLPCPSAWPPPGTALSPWRRRRLLPSARRGSGKGLPGCAATC